MFLQHQSARYATILLTGLVGLSLAGCAPAEPPVPGRTSAIQSPGATAPSSPAPTKASASPSASSTPSTASSPSATSSPSSPASTAPATTTAQLTVFYVAVDDQGKSGPMIGCGDSLVATKTGPVAFTNQVEAAMQALLKDKSATHGESGLTNALAASTLRYKSSKVSGGTVTVNLTGTPMSSGTCDDPRIIEQLKYTAKTAAGVGKARILIDGTDIDKFLSQE